MNLYAQYTSPAALKNLMHSGCFQHGLIVLANINELGFVCIYNINPYSDRDEKYILFYLYVVYFMER